MYFLKDINELRAVKHTKNEKIKQQFKLIYLEIMFLWVGSVWLWAQERIYIKYMVPGSTANELMRFKNMITLMQFFNILKRLNFYKVLLILFKWGKGNHCSYI